MDSIIPSLMEKFNGAEIRIIEEDNDIWIPVVDIATAIGYGNDQLTRLVRNNIELFDGFNRTTSTVAPEGNPIRLVCVNEQGFYMLLSKVSLNQLGDQEVKKSIIEFNRWMVDTVRRMRESKVYKPQYGDYLKQEMIIVEELNRVLELDKTLLTNIALENTEKHTGVSMLPYKQMLPAVDGVVAVLRATDIGNELGIPAATVNIILEKIGYIVREHKQWLITDLGKKWGKAYFEAKSHDNGSLWSGAINKWSPQVVEQIREYLTDN